MTAAAVPPPDVASNLRLAYALAWRFRRQNPHLCHVPAEDLLQAAALGLVEAARAYDPAGGAAFSTYATQGARNALKTEVYHHVKAARSLTVGEETWPFDSEAYAAAGDRDSADAGPHALTFPDELRRRLPDLLSRLPEDERRVLSLRYYDGLSFRSVAARLGVPVYTARRAALRGLNSLRRWVGAEEKENL